MLPSIEFYMSANSPAHNVKHLISLFFDPPPSLPPSPVTRASGQMDGRSCIHFFNCAKRFGVRKGTQCWFCVASFPWFLFPRHECRASSLSPQPATRMWWMPSTESLPRREFGGQWEGWMRQQWGQDPPMPSILPAMRNWKRRSVMSFTQGLTVIWLMVPPNMHMHTSHKYTHKRECGDLSH